MLGQHVRVSADVWDGVKRRDATIVGDDVVCAPNRPDWTGRTAESFLVDLLPRSRSKHARQVLCERRNHAINRVPPFDGGRRWI